MQARFTSSLSAAACGLGRRGARSRAMRRRGYGSLLFVFALIIFILLLVLVLNYSYLVYSQLRTSDITDTLARTAVTELLDDSRLAPVPTVNQADDVADTEQTVAVFLGKLNDASPANQRLRYVIGSSDPNQTDIYVTPGWVDNVEEPITTGGANPNFDTTPPANTPYNTLRIESLRTKTGGNPLYQFVQLLLAPGDKVELETASYATLDSRVIGFQPTDELNCPVVPIAIQAGQWTNRADHLPGGDQLEFRGALRPPSGGNPFGDQNIVLLNFRQDVPNIQPTQIASQIEDGTPPNWININGGTFLGPVLENVFEPVVPADRNTPAGANGTMILNALNNVAASDDPRRIFPLYENFSPPGGGTANIVGFVAAKVRGAQQVSGPPGPPGQSRLVVYLEPEFIIHPTVVTSRQVQDGPNTFNVPENVYIHKLRLSR